MSLTRRRMMLVSAAACMTGSHASASPNRFSFAALGAHGQITLPGEAERARRAMLACREEIEQIENLFSLWKPNSALSTLNREGRVAINDIRFTELLNHSREISDLTDGGFDVTVQPLWTALAQQEDPSEAAALVDWQGFEADTHGAYFARVGMSATFNGIAQGYAADRVIMILKSAGYRGALANLGEFHGIGSRPDGEPWQIGIANPLTGAIAATHALQDSAIATSEPQATLIRGNPHIFDPLSRAGPRWASVTVVAKAAWRADAVSTVVAAAPMDEAQAILTQCCIDAATLITPSGKIETFSP